MSELNIEAIPTPGPEECDRIVASVLVEAAYRLREITPEGYTHRGGRLVRTRPDLPEYAVLPSVNGKQVKVFAVLDESAAG